MLEWIKVFQQVVDSGSFSQAGQVLNMAPSSIARNIDNLEEKLQTSLFKRSTRQLILTEEGEYFLKQGTKLVDDAEQLLADMRGSNQTPQGRLRISVFESFGNMVIAPLLPAFLARYPDIKVELDLDNKVVDLNSENIDIAIRIGQPQDSNLKARNLLTNRTKLVATPAYLQQYKNIKKPQDVAVHNCLSISHERQSTQWCFQQGKLQHQVTVKGNFTSRGGSALLNVALKNGGLLLVSSWIVQPYLDNQQLVEVLPEWDVNYVHYGDLKIFAIYKSSQYPKPHIRAFIDYLVENLKIN